MQGAGGDMGHRAWGFGLVHAGGKHDVNAGHHEALNRGWAVELSLRSVSSLGMDKRQLIFWQVFSFDQKMFSTLFH